MKELTRVQTSKLMGGASASRCARMLARFERRGSDYNSNLWGRILKNCTPSR